MNYKLLMTPILLMSLLFGIPACQKSPDESGEQIPAQQFSNVKYGTDTAQKMDVYLPKDRTDTGTKVMVMIHGGAWTEGDKADLASYVAVLQQRLPDYAFVNINYRLATQVGNHFPAQEDDIQAAINYIYERKGEYKISDKLVLLGASAGAHLALLQAYKHTSPVKAKAVVSFFAPSDLTTFYNSQNALYQYGLTLLVGGTPGGNPVAYQQSSPYYFVTAQSPPTLMLHGDKDPLVPLSQPQALYSKLQAAGVTSSLVIYPNEGHGWEGTNLTNSFDRIVTFLRANGL